MIVVIMLLNPNPAADELDYYSSVINHELGHVLGLGHAPSNETDDLMCECLLSTPPSTISTLDLYAAHIVASGRVKVE
jgi:predicted Zn-dependent protease